MKNTPEPSTRPKAGNNGNNRNHTVVIAGDDKGGVTKSCSCAAVADALMSLGYTLRLADGDTANRTLSKMMPAARINGKSEDDLNAFIGESAKAAEDITIIDMPGSSGDMLSHYFNTIGFDTFSQFGVRIVVALALTQTEDAVQGAKAWVKTFMDKTDFIGFANLRDTPVGEEFCLDHIKNGRALLGIPEGIIHIPRWSDTMIRQFSLCKASPTGYLQGGAAAAKLNLNLLSWAGWAVFHNRVTASTANMAEWLTGKPLPKPAPEVAEDKPMSAEKAALVGGFEEE